MAFGLGRTRGVNEVDVVNVYKIFLGRSPESQNVIDEKLKFSVEDLILTIIQSGEFLSDVVALIIAGDIAVSGRFQGVLSPDINIWARNIFEFEASSNDIELNTSWPRLIQHIVAAMRSDAVFGASGHNLFSHQFESALLRWCEAERGASITGGIDLCDAQRVIGWVLDRDNLDAALIVEVFANGRFMAAARPDKFRRELQATYGGAGVYGFSIDLKNTIDINDGRRAKIELVESSTRKLVASADVETQTQRSLDLLNSINLQLKDIKDKISSIESLVPAIRNVTSFSVSSYNAYVEAYKTQSPLQNEIYRSYWQGRTHFPIVSVIINACEADIEYLNSTIESFLGQSYNNAELIIAYAEPRDGVRARPWIDVLLERSAAPTRQLWPEAVIDRSAVLSSAISETRGEVVCWLNSGDLLADGALHHIAKALNEQPQYSVYLSDEDEFTRISDSRVLYHSPKFNPAYDPLTLAQVELFAGVVAVQGEFIRRFDASEGLAGDDPFIRLARLCDAAGAQGVKHIPRVLLHRSRPRAQVEAGRLEQRRAYVQARQDRRGEGGKVEIAQDPLGATIAGCLRIAPAGLEGVTATVIIPTRDNYDLLRACIDGLINTIASNVVTFEILVIDNGSKSQKILDYFAELQARERVSVIRDDRPFNWAALNNAAAKSSASDVIIFMNDDMAPIIQNWCDELCFWALRPGTGAVGTRLIYGDGSIQHAGIVGGVFGLASHEGVGDAGNDPGYLGRHALVRKAMAVTGACMAVRRSVFEQLGGFDAETFAVAYNDLDFCLRAQQANLDVIYTPYASFYHFESQSRGFDHLAAPPDKIERSREAKAALLRWGERLLGDPTYNPHFERWTRPFTRLTAIDRD